MFELMTLSPLIASKENAPKLLLKAEEANISFENVCFEYIQGKKILDSLSFSVPAGKRVAIVGGSGSGKSTLIRLLYRFYEPTSGSIQIGGKNINDLDLESLRKNIAIVPQDSVLFHNTVNEEFIFLPIFFKLF
jgi:ATP-binding cassette subfamily B (MDR/TAP) protein 7